MAPVRPACPVRRRRLPLWSRALLLGTLPVLASAGASAAQCPDGTPPPCAGTAPTRTRVLVVPFASPADSSSAALAAMLTEDLAAALTRARSIELLVPQQPPGHAQLVVRGRAAREGAVVRVAVSVERAASGRLVYAARFEQSAARPLAARDSIVRGVFAAVGAPAPPTPMTGFSSDPVANDLYARGRYHVARRRQADVTAAYGYFSQAIARDSSFARAWAGLARTLDWAQRYDLEVPGVAKDGLTDAEANAIRTALRLDSTDSESWVLRAQVALAVDPADAVPARRALDRALRLDSTNATAWENYAWLLARLDDSSGAVAAWRRAAAGGGAAAVPLRAQFLTWWRSYDRAAVLAESAVTADPTLMFARETVGDVAILRGRLDQAESAYDAARRLGTGREVVRSLSGLARVAAARGDTAGARALAAQAAAQPDPERPGPDGVVAVAAAYAACGARDSAIAWLSRYRPRSDLHFQLHLRRDPALDPLRGDARFRGLVAPVPQAP